MFVENIVKFTIFFLFFIIGRVHVSPIIIKEFPFHHLRTKYAIEPISHLHTLAVPKSYLANLPKNYVAPEPYLAPTIGSNTGLYKITQNFPTILDKVKKKLYENNPSYSYDYAVNDPTTGDVKSAQESLIDGVVKGSYSLAEPDGTIRKVTYTADDIRGFQAIVEKIDHRVKPISSLSKRPIVAAPYRGTSVYNPRASYYFHK